VTAGKPIKAGIAVVGLGAAGAATLWHLARAGCDVVGIEQFSPVHDRGSSHGQTRLVRVAYAEDERYVPLVRRAIALWRELEKAVGEKLFHQTGVFYAGDPQSAFMHDSMASARAHGVEMAHLDTGRTQAKTRNALTIPSTWTSFIESEGGFVLAERAVAAFVAQAQRAGARLMKNTKVAAVTAGPFGVEIATSAGTVFADKVVVAGGAWTSELLPELSPRLAIERRVLHWFADPSGAYSLAAGFKPFIADAADGQEFYGFPAIDAAGVKVAEHDVRAAPHAPVMSADQLDRRVHPNEVERIRDIVRRRFTGLEGPIASTVCMYPMSTDGHFIVDRLPSSERVVVAAGLSGHGFKFAPLVGELAAGLVLGKTPSVDARFLSLARFG
jgi:sarcosine oxidase